MNQWIDIVGDVLALALDDRVDGSRQLLLHGDLTTPSTQEVYASLARLATVTGLTWTEWYLGNLASGDWTGVAGTVLTKGAGTFRFQQTWPGWDGTDMTSGFRAVEFLGTAGVTQSFSHASAYDANQSLTFIVCSRSARQPGIQGLLGKKVAFAAANPGYSVYVSGLGELAAIVADGSTQVNVFAPLSATGLHSVWSGAPQWWAFKMNMTTGMAQFLATRAAGTAVAMPAGAKTNASPFYFGGNLFLNSAAQTQVLAWGVLTGADAEAFGLTELNLLDNWCRVPAQSQLDHYDRRCVTAPIVGVDATGVRVQHCAGSTTTTALSHVAHGYSANATKSTQKLGLECQQATANSSDTAATLLKKRNRLLQTDNMAHASWVATNVTKAANAGEDPAGFFAAASLTASANNGTVTQDFTGETGEIHTVSFFAQRNQGTDVAARLSLYNSVGPVEIVGLNITIGALRERFSLTATAAQVGAITTLQWRLTITTNTDSVFATFPQAEFGTLTSYQPQISALIDRVSTEAYYDNADGAIYDPRGGRVEATVCGYASTAPYTGCFIVSTDAGASNEDRHFIQRDALTSTYPREARIYDAAGTIISMLTDIANVDHMEETTYASEWEAHRTLPGDSARHRAEVDNVATETGAVIAVAPWVVGTNADRVFPGMRHSYSAHVEGIVEVLKVWGL